LPGQYAAILGDKVIDHDPDYSALAERVFSKYGVRSLYMPKVGEADRVVRIGRPAVLRA